MREITKQGIVDLVQKVTASFKNNSKEHPQGHLEIYHICKTRIEFYKNK